MDIIDNAINELDDLDDDFNSNDYIPASDIEYEIAAEVFDFLQGIVDREDSLTEDFTSYNKLEYHFNRHCLGLHPDSKKVSQYTKVYYDFKYLNEYRNYEESINKKMINLPLAYQPTLLDTETLFKCFRKLFEGNFSMLLPAGAGFENDLGPVQIGLNSFATKYTSNYRAGNTINMIILTPKNKTITMYAIDAHYLETKLNNIIEKYNTNKIKLKFNND